ncbi:TRAP transporter small permease [Marinobacter subterrani]|uniref:TRAP transporter small permease n=1 Tax=Marinobacter subterrani TaxID=1658765 RepID=UPI002354D7C4|nr:TRAP transporter small permease [Marinobacter subterrani]
MSIAKQSWGGLLAILRWTSVAVLFFMMVSVCYDATMRYLFAAPTSWSLEINSFLLIYIAVVGAAEAQYHDAHIRITYFVDKMPASVRAWIAVFGGLLGAGFCAVMVWRGGEMAFDAFKYGERVSSAFGTPMVIPYGMLPVGFGALALQFLIDALKAARLAIGHGDYPEVRDA